MTLPPDSILALHWEEWGDKTQKTKKSEPGLQGTDYTYHKPEKRLDIFLLNGSL